MPKCLFEDWESATQILLKEEWNTPDTTTIIELAQHNLRKLFKFLET